MVNRLALVDIDGVLADTRHRDTYAVNRQWGTYFGLMHLDGVWRQGLEVLEYIHMCYDTVEFLTGRREDTREVTRAWLREHLPKPLRKGVKLRMRALEDRTPLPLLKARHITEALPQFRDGVALWDDDPAVIEAANAVLPGAGRHCTWYTKPESIIKRAKF